MLQESCNNPASLLLLLTTPIYPIKSPSTLPCIRDMIFLSLWTRLCLLLTTILHASATPAVSVNLIGPDYNAASAPIVNLGYANYQGYYDSSFGLNVFKRCATTAIYLVTLRTLEKSIDTDLAAFDTQLLQPARCVGKHLKPPPEATPSSRP